MHRSHNVQPYFPPTKTWLPPHGANVNPIGLPKKKEEKTNNEEGTNHTYSKHHTWHICRRNEIKEFVFRMYENNRGLPHSFGFYDALQLLMAGGIWYDYIRRIGLWHAPILVWATLCANLMCHSIFYSNVDTMERCTNNDRQIRERNIAAGTHRETGRNIYRERERNTNQDVLHTEPSSHV